MKILKYENNVSYLNVDGKDKKLLEISKEDILKALEEARSEKVIGKSLNANVIIYPTDKVAKLLTTVKVDFKQIFIVYRAVI